MNKLNFLFLLYIITNVVPCFGQIVKSKDGVSLGKRSEFISACTKGADKKLMNINGLEIESYKYCACVCDNLIPTINSWEMEKAMKENNERAFAQASIRLPQKEVAAKTPPGPTTNAPKKHMGEWHYMSTDPKHHALRAVGHQLYERPNISNHHYALKEHFDGTKPLTELEVKRHQKALKDYYSGSTKE